MLVTPMDAKRRWMFKVPQNESLMAKAIFDHMAKNGVKTVAYIGFNDGYGESWWKEAQVAADLVGIKLVISERFGKTDTSVTGQTLENSRGEARCGPYRRCGNTGCVTANRPQAARLHRENLPDAWCRQ